MNLALGVKLIHENYVIMPYWSALMGRIFKLKPFADKRKYSRKDCMIPTSIKHNNGSSNNRLLNISLGGAFLQTDDNFLVGQEISMGIQYLGIRESFDIDGRITHEIPGVGIGIRFENVYQHQKDKINYLWR